MKRISIILMMLSAAVFASCNKALEKDVVEAGFAPAQPVPTVSNLVVSEVNEVEKIAVLTATVEGITSGMDSLEVGFMSCLDGTFQNSTAVLVNPENGTITATVSVMPGAKNYFVAMAATLGGASYSDVISYDVPDIPMYAKLAKSYAGTYYSYFDAGVPVAHALNLLVSDDHTEVTLYHFDPFIGKYVAPGLEANCFTGKLDQENFTITFTTDTPPFFMFGFADAAVVVTDAAGNALSEFVVTISKDCQSITIPEYGVYSVNQGGYYEAWGGNEDGTGSITLKAR